MTLADVVSVVAAAILSVGGAGAIMIGLSKFFGERIAERWLEDVKAGYARQLTLVQHGLDQLSKQNQAQLDHAVTVSRAQFEEEFRSLREIWKFIARSRAAVVAIVETKVPNDDTPEKKLERFFEARNEVAEAQKKTGVRGRQQQPVLSGVGLSGCGCLPGADKA